MRKIMLFLSCLLGFPGFAVVYDEYEITLELNQPKLQQLSQHFTQIYFTSSSAETAIDEIIKANITPLQREYILFNILAEISQQPPQAYHQYLVDLMKSYPVQANRAADEGPFPVAVFNLNSKAYGIENIWLAYRTEQRFNQLFNNNTKLALIEIQAILSDQSRQQRPQWLGVKNSIAALSNNNLVALVQQLQLTTQVNAGLDLLISHVGLITADEQLINKALASNNRSIRQTTLRSLTDHLTGDMSKSILLAAAKNNQDTAFANSLLAAFSNDIEIQNHLIDQLNINTAAESAAFALSKSNDFSLVERLKIEYLKTNEQNKQNHILLALKLNQSLAAKQALIDLKAHINSNSKGTKWLDSFSGDKQ